MADDEALSGAIDTMKPWTIKSISTQAINQAIAAARRENVTVGQWLERRISEWDEQGAAGPPAIHDRPAGQSHMGDLIETVRLAMALSERGQRPKDPLLRTARGTVRAALLALRPVAKPAASPTLPGGGAPNPRQKRLSN